MSVLKPSSSSETVGQCGREGKSTPAAGNARKREMPKLVQFFGQSDW